MQWTKKAKKEKSRSLQSCIFPKLLKEENIFRQTANILDDILRTLTSFLKI